MNGGNRVLRQLLKVLVFVTSAAVALVSVATTPVGTIIENVADLTYIDVNGLPVVGRSGVATVTVGFGINPGLPPAFVLEKTSAAPCGSTVTLSDPIAYEVRIRNEGGVPAHLSTVDLGGGSSIEGVLVIDPVPANTVLLAGSVSASPAAAVPLLHPVGADLDSWILAADWDGEAPVDRVALLIPTNLAGPGADAKLAFEVRLAEGVRNGTPFFNRAGIDGNGDGSFDGSADFTSPEVCNFVDAPGTLPDPEINFLQPADLAVIERRTPDISVDADWASSDFYQLNPNDLLRQGVWLQLDATQLNRSGVDLDFVMQDIVAGEVGAASSATVRLLQVTLESLGTGDELLVTLRETGPNTGDFRSIYPVYLTENPIPGVTDADVACPLAATADELVLYTEDTDVAEALEQGCALHAVRKDDLRVSFDVPVFGPGGLVTRLQAVEDVAAVDPAGTVFDSRTGAPVSGALVALMQSLRPLADTGFDSCPELPLDQYERALDPFTGEVQPVEITDATHEDNAPNVGDYAYPFATPFHCYYLDVTPPPGYFSPSDKSAQELAEFSDIVSDPSYGAGGFRGRPGRGNAGAFLLQLENLFFDVPLDPELAELPQNPLRLTKTVDRREAEIGDVVVYDVTVENATATTALALRVEDRIPFGFRFVKGTARLEVDGAETALANPDGMPGPDLTFAFPGVSLAPGASLRLSYALRLSAGSVDGSGVNSAVAYGETLALTPLASNVDRVGVAIRQTGVLSDRAILFGKVYVDADCNDVQNDGEWPVGGVRLVMEDGTWVITDENGQFSLFDVAPGQHVLRVDPATLPAGLELKLIDTRQAGSPQSRFVDLRPGEMHRADFAAHCPGPEADKLYAALQARNESINGSWLLEEAERFDPRRQAVAAKQVIDSDGAVSGGRVGPATAAGDTGLGDSESVGGTSEIVVPVTTASADAASADAGPRASRRAAANSGQDDMPTPEEVAPTLTREQGRAGEWLWPRDGRANDGRFMAVIRGGVTPTLFIDDVAVKASQLGEQILNREADAQVVAWYGVDLEEGQHRVEVRTVDAFGNARVLVADDFVRAGTAARLEIQPAGDQLAADGGRSTLAVTIRLLDADGRIARGTDFVTIETTEGDWLEEDLQDRTPGHQVLVRDGEAVVHLRSGHRTGRATLRASNGAVEDRAFVSFVAARRPLLVAGIADVQTRFGSKVDDDGRRPDGDLDIGRNQTDERVALFMEGQVRGDAHLTLSYDSERDREELLRDIRPDGGFYPIPGDASMRGFEARSRSPLYAKLEKERHSVLWGDFVTDTGSDFTDLARVQKTLTGANLVFDNGATRLRVFGAEQDEQRVVEEFDGNGTALDFRVRQDIVRHSETVELRVRDRDTPGLVLDSRSLARFEDYTIDYLTGRIRFHEAVPSLDEDLNPVSVFVTYDVEGRGEKYDVIGARVEQRLGERLRLGASHSYDGHSEDGSELSGATVAYEGAATRIAVSAATMESKRDGLRGEGYRIDLEHNWGAGANSRATFGRGEEGFRNASGGVSENRQELRFEHKQQLAGRSDFRLAGTHSEQLDTEDAQTSVQADLLTDVAGVRVATGLRGIRQDSAEGTDSFATGEVGLRHSGLLAGAPLSLGAEFEHALDGSRRQRAAVDMEWALRDNLTSYGTYELTDSLQGAAALANDSKRSNFVFGMRADLMADTETFSEYRLRGTADGRGEVAAQGVRGSYEVRPGLTFAPSLERIDTISGPDNGDGLALSLGIVDHRHDDARRRLRVETRLGKASDFYGLSGSWVARLDTDWSVAAREELRVDMKQAARNAVNQVLTLGLARRPRRDNGHHILLLYQWEMDRGANGVDRNVHLFSTHQNREVGESLIVSGRAGFKLATTEVAGVEIETDAAILDGRVIHELTDRIDIDVHGGLLVTEGFNELRYAFGAGVGMLVRRDLRLTAGYNFIGFEDQDLDEERFLAQGFYVGLQLKFDEDSFQWLTGARP